MGGGSWSNEAYSRSVTTRSATRGAVFAHDQDVRQGRVQTAVHESLNPRGINYRESRDSAEHPESNPIIVGLDVTGSMSRVVKTIHEKLPTLMTLLNEKGYITDPQILMAAVGDHHGDRAPLQVGQFESDARVEEHLSNMFLEGNGGGARGAEYKHESYQLLGYFAAFKTKIDSLEKRDKKGYLFIIGDELPYAHTSKASLQAIFEHGVEGDISTENIFQAAKEKYNVFYILPRDASHGSDSEVIAGWTQLLGSDHVIRLDRADAIAELIAVKIGQMEGTLDLERARTDLGANPAAASVLGAVYNRVLDL